MSGIDTLVMDHRHETSQECRSWLIWQTVSAQMELTSVELVLIMRGKLLTIACLIAFFCVLINVIYLWAVHALYGQSRKVLVVLSSLYALENVIMAVSLGISVSQSRSTSNCETVVPLTITGYGYVFHFSYLWLDDRIAYTYWVGMLSHIGLLRSSSRRFYWSCLHTKL